MGDSEFEGQAVHAVAPAWLYVPAEQSTQVVLELRRN
jgi:hypothetical protein